MSEDLSEKVGAETDMHADFPEITPGRITYDDLRRIIKWEQKHGVNSVSLDMLEAYRDEGQTAPRAGLELGLIDYGQASGWTD